MAIFALFLLIGFVAASSIAYFYKLKMDQYDYDIASHADLITVQNIFIELIRVLMAGGPREYDRWVIRTQSPNTAFESDVPDSAFTFEPFLKPTSTSLIRPGAMGRHAGIKQFVDARYDRDQGQADEEALKQIEQERLRQENQLEIDRKRMLQEFDVEKQRNQEVIRLESEKFKQTFKNEAAAAIFKAQTQESRLQHERWKTLLAMMGGAMRSIILMQAELKNNPAAQDIINDLNQIYTEMKQFDPAATLDEENLTEIVQQVLLKSRGYGYVG